MKKWLLLLLVIPVLGKAQGLFTTGFWQVAGLLTLGSFSITGVTGGTDSTADAWLVNATEPTVAFGTSANATSYDVIVKDNSETTTVCTVTGSGSSPVALTSCGLSNSTTYKVFVTAKVGSSTRSASNDGFSFAVDNTTPTANTITGLTGAADSTADAWLVGGVVPTLNWNAFTNASSYDVTIRDSAGSTVICTTANTTSTNHNFSSCNLVDGTSYRAYVTAKSPSGFNTVNASNTAFSFTVDNTSPGSFSITGITGGTDSVVDNALTNGSDPTVNYGTSSNTYRYDIEIKDSTGTTTICTSLNQTSSPTAVSSCGLVNGTTYKAYVKAKSISTFLTTNASNTGYSFTVGAAPASAPGNFQITGATGGADSTADSWLTDGTTVTANWVAASGATSYDVTIRNAADSADVCATQNTTATSYAFSGCTLVVGTTYKIKVTAKNGLNTVAINNGYSFQVTQVQPGDFNIKGVQGGTDTTDDAYLFESTTVTVSWTTSSGATSYDVTIRNAGDTADVCATQNTASTSYTFSSCALTAGTSYVAKVIAKSGSQTVAAVNSGYSFHVVSTVTFCPTGTSDKPALIVYDSGGSGSNYSNSQNCNFRITPAVAPNSIQILFHNFLVNDSNDIFRIYDGTSTAGTYLNSPGYTLGSSADLKTATSGSMYLTWVSNSNGNAAGYKFHISSSWTAAGNFNITGVSGGTDSTADALLTDNSSGVTLAWGASSNAKSYKAVIRNSSNSIDICPLQSTTSTSLSFSGCSLTFGLKYVAIVYAVDGNGISKAASNGPFTFTYDNKPMIFSITGVTGGSDAVADSHLENGTTVTINWQASSYHDSYDVTIFENDGQTVKCAKVNVAAASTSHTFTGCSLTAGSNYKAEVIAKNVNGSVLATNSPMSFFVGVAWENMNLSLAPSARTGHSAVWTGSEMIVWGGYSSGATTNTGGRYNPTTDSWSPTGTGSNVPSPRYGQGAVWTGTEMIIWGGSSGWHSLSTGGRYNPSSDTWSESSLSLVDNRFHHSAVWTGTEMIIWGGTTTGNLPINTGGKYNPTTDSWSNVSTGANVPAARRYHTAIWTGTEMIIWGGEGNSISVPINSGGKYNPSTDTWAPTSTGSNVPSARYYHTAVWTGTEMIIWGGSTNSTPSYTNTGGKYNPSTDSWALTSTGTNVPAARLWHTAVWTGTEMIIWGGAGGSILDTGARYNPSTDAWTPTSTGTNKPLGRYSHSAVWTGSEMIVWGGSWSYEFNDGARYNPSTDTWLATSMGANVPDPRKHHTAIWTGTEMIIWGGLYTDPEWGFETFLNTGSRYNPSTNTWTLTNTGANSPKTRAYHTAVWTGAATSEMIIFGGKTDYSEIAHSNSRYKPSTDSWTLISGGPSAAARTSFGNVWTGTEMIVWGGYGRSNSGAVTFLDTGGRYNPTTDSWTATSTGANLPSPRGGVKAVWTGTEMIIWGGTFSAGVLPTDGGRYNPTTDSWLATSTTGAPAGRNYLTAVWTGTEMIIWGGNSGSYLNTGGRYNPSTNSWTPTSTGTNVPSAREDHTAVWTGSDMVVWGGTNGSRMNTGGKYNPSSDTWTPTSLNGSVLSARDDHTAVWTGQEMIIFGGHSGGGYLGDGGILIP